MEPETTAISRIGERNGREATVRGWLYNRRSSGKIQFLIVRDGTGYLQTVVVKADVLAGDLGGGGAGNPGELARRERYGPRGQARPRRLRDERDESRNRRAVGGVPDHAEGTWRRLPPLAAAPLDALGAAARRPEGALGSLPGDPRLLLRAGLRPDRLAHPDGLLGRGDVDPLRDGLLRREGVPVAVGSALPRARRGGVRKGLLLRSDVPGGEVEDPAPPDGVLDDRARGRLPRVRRPLRPRGGVRHLAHRAHARPVRRGPEAARARHVEARGGGAPVSRGPRTARPSRSSPPRASR